MQVTGIMYCFIKESSICLWKGVLEIPLEQENDEHDLAQDHANWIYSLFLWVWRVKPLEDQFICSVNEGHCFLEIAFNNA